LRQSLNLIDYGILYASLHKRGSAKKQAREGGLLPSWRSRAAPGGRASDRVQHPRSRGPGGELEDRMSEQHDGSRSGISGITRGEAGELEDRTSERD
jgi:hypothetical protein